MAIEKYLTLARRAREEDNTEDAKRYYDMVRTEDPDNTEGRFFYAYYRLWDGKKGEAYDKYVDFCKVVVPVVNTTAESDAPYDEKKAFLLDVLSSIRGLPASINGVLKDLWQVASDSGKSEYNSKMKSCQKIGIEMLYGYGDAIEKHFSDQAAIMAIAADAWKKGVELNQQYPYCGIDKTLSEKYAAKIQKIDPTYTPPKKAGCISFG